WQLLPRRHRQKFMAAGKGLSMSILSPVDSIRENAPESAPLDSTDQPEEALPDCSPSGPPARPAWIEVDLKQLKRNFQIINQDKPAALKLLSVVKDDGYGHGALQVARVALECGAAFLGLATLDEAIALRGKGITAPLL